MTTSTPSATILVLDDEKNIRQSIDIALSTENIQVVQAHDPAAALRVLQERVIELLILDIHLGEVDGLAFFKSLLSAGYHMPTIFISGQASLTQAAQAVKMGGYDFIEKPFSAEKIVTTVQRGLEYSRLNQKIHTLESIQGKSLIIGDSPALRQLVSETLKVAQTQANVLIRGESGTGKELVANTLHSHSPRSQGPFVKVNCSAIPENLIESELFGYERGAFTGAQTSKRGLFELAHRGTLFLDEVADLSMAAQAKLLRVLQNGEIQKVGSEKILKVDVRVLSGSHKDLKKMVTTGHFREDLFYRLNVVPLKVPSLRERPEDIPLLAQHFVRQLCEKNNFKEKKIHEDVFWILKKYTWPGNVRELQNLLERVVILSGPQILPTDLPEEIQVTNDETAPSAPASFLLKEFRDKAEREFIVETIRKHKGNITQSAAELGVGRTYLHKRLLVLQIEKKELY